MHQHHTMAAHCCGTSALICHRAALAPRLAVSRQVIRSDLSVCVVLGWLAIASVCAKEGECGGSTYTRAVGVVDRFCN